MYTCIFIYLHLYICLYAYIYVYIYVCLHTYIHKYLCVQVCTNLYMPEYLWRRRLFDPAIDTHVWYMCVYRHLCVHIHMYIYMYIHVFACVCIYAYTHVYVYICARIKMHMYTCMYIYTHKHLYVMILIHIYICIFITWVTPDAPCLVGEVWNLVTNLKFCCNKNTCQNTLDIPYRKSHTNTQTHCDHTILTDHRIQITLQAWKQTNNKTLIQVYTQCKKKKLEAPDGESWF